MKIIFLIAIQNLKLHKIKSMMIACILMLATFLACLGLTSVFYIEKGLTSSVVHSVVGHLQVYSEESLDSLSFFGQTSMSRLNLGEIPSYSHLRDKIKEHPNVKDTMLMGMDFALMFSRNELDLLFESFRKDIKENGKLSEGNLKIWYQVLENLKADISREFSIAGKEMEETKETLEKVENPSFVESLQKGDEDSLMFLETKVAALAGESTMIFLNLIGTDIESYPRVFEKFRLAGGHLAQKGERGLYVGKSVYENMFKNYIARTFDEIKKQKEKGESIEKTVSLQATSKRLPKRYMKILSYLSQDEIKLLEKELSSFLRKEGSMGELLIDFLTIDDAHFKERYDFFYAQIAPLIEMYAAVPGDIIEVQASTKSGYRKRLSVPFLGVYAFDGLEESEIAGAFSLLDMVSFRELYGHMSQEELEEIQSLREEEAVDMTLSEEDLFQEESFVLNSEEKKFEAPSLDKTKTAQELAYRPFSVKELEEGLAIHMAVFLKNPQLLDQTLKELSLMLSEEKMKAVPWQEASGFIGWIIYVIKGLFFVAFFILFLIGIVIINNAILVSTIERT